MAQPHPRARIAPPDEVLRLPYVAPYDFDEVLAFLERRAIPSIERVHDGGYERIVGDASAPSWIRVTACADAPALELRVLRPVPGRTAALAADVRRMFDLDADPGAVGSVLSRDPKLRALVRRNPGQRVPRAWSVFEVAIRAVLGQQVSVAAARTQALRVVRDYGTAVTSPAIAELDRVFPAPEALAQADLAGVGLTRARAETVRTVSGAVAEARVGFDGSDLERFVASWVELRGIGDWTAQYIALRGLGHPDAFPAGDLVLRRVLSRDDRMLTEREARERASRWRPWRAYGVLHLWRAASAAA